MWANIQRIGDKKAIKIVKNLRDYKVESPQFKLVVSQESQLRDRMESPLDPGIYESVTVGYYILIRSLSTSTYLIHFGGKGRSTYYTESVYDVTVQGNKKRGIQ